MKQSLKIHHGAKSITFIRAKLLRKKCTPAEKNLWKMVRNRKMLGLKFRRQHPLVKYIADFYCHEALLVIELDGSVHDSEISMRYDANRDKIITDLGITVLRFKNEVVFSNPEQIEKEIQHHLLSRF